MSLYVGDPSSVHVWMKLPVPSKPAH